MLFSKAGLPLPFGNLRFFAGLPLLQPRVAKATGSLHYASLG
jgi:hypothetical protein